MKKIFLFLMLTCFGMNINAQIDRSSGTGMPIKGLGIPVKTSETPSLEIPRNPSLSKKDGIFKNTPKLTDPTKDKEPFSMSTDNGLLEREVEFNPAYLEDKAVKDEFSEDTYLGDFKTGGTSVDLFCRDHEFVDGDKVRILVNDKVVYNSVRLIGSYKGILIKLERGFNKIDIVALNQGSSGPNTAEFKLLDDKGKLLTLNEWNLTTGTKGTLIVVKE